MKRLIYIFAALLALTLTACGGPKIDETMVEMDSFMEQQSTPGLYRKSIVEFAFDESKHQSYLSPDKLTYRIMDDSGIKYLQFVLSQAPVVDGTVDVVTTSFGVGLSTNATYTNLKVEKIENNRCVLRSDADGGYVGIIIGWME